MLASVARRLPIASLIQLAGGGCFSAAAYLAWGLAASLAVAGGVLVAFGIAAEMPKRDG